MARRSSDLATETQRNREDSSLKQPRANGVMTKLIALVLLGVGCVAAHKLIQAFWGESYAMAISFLVFCVLLPVALFFWFIGFLIRRFSPPPAENAKEEEDDENEDDEVEEDQDEDEKTDALPVCKYCGKAISAGERTCSSCQAPVPRTQEQEQFERKVRLINAKQGKMAAAKFYAEQTGTGLGEAKEFVESL